LNPLFSIVSVAGPPVGLPARNRQMICLTVENKYCFNMEVSARAMGSRDRSDRQSGHGAAQIIFDI
jgi:hypothetical protein